MSSLKQLLFVIAVAGAIGSGSALAVEPAHTAASAAPSSPSLQVASAQPGPSYRVAGAAPIRYASADAVIAPGAPSPGAIRGEVRAGRADADAQLTAPQMPEPSEGMQLLCGLLLAGFMAWRRASFVSG